MWSSVWRTVPDTSPQAPPSPPSISSVRADRGPSFSSPPAPAWPAAPPPPPVWCSIAFATKGGTKPPRPDTPAVAPPPPAPPRGLVNPWRGACRGKRQAAISGGQWHDGLQVASTVLIECEDCGDRHSSHQTHARPVPPEGSRAVRQAASAPPTPRAQGSHGHLPGWQTCWPAGAAPSSSGLLPAACGPT